MLKGTNTQHSEHMGTKKFTLNLWLKSILRVQLGILGKYYSCNLAITLIKTHEGDEKWPLFVNKSCFGGLWTITMLIFQTCRHFSHSILHHILQLA